MRTSQGTFIGRSEDKDGVLAWIEDKIALLAGIPAGHGEVRCPPLPPLLSCKRWPALHPKILKSENCTRSYNVVLAQNAD